MRSILLGTFIADLNPELAIKLRELVSELENYLSDLSVRVEVAPAYISSKCRLPESEARRRIELLNSTHPDLYLELQLTQDPTQVRAESISTAGKLYARSILDNLSEVGYKDAGLFETTQFVFLKSIPSALCVQLCPNQDSNLPSIAKAIAAGIFTVAYPI